MLVMLVMQSNSSYHSVIVRNRCIMFSIEQKKIIYFQSTLKSSKSGRRV